ncbi:ParB N-terminal domain-containing protein [Candidatus Nomurabacteria bacterium]|nr:ParB N-terminal domain-containing protein [Candidatus Nomurabacteria bacterium]
MNTGKVKESATITVDIPSNNEAEIKILRVERLTDEMLEGKLSDGTPLIDFLSESCHILPIDDFKVYKTKNYRSFKHLLGNRDLKEQHVHKLMESYHKDGYLFTIIYVNEKLEIIDGQHRFEAAKRKHLPVYFLIIPNWGIDHVSILNVNSSNWTAEDFLNTHAKSGNSSYVLFKSFYDKYEFDITTAQIIILGRRVTAGKNNDDFRSGKMKLEPEQITRAHEKAKKINMMKDFHPYAWKSRNCVDAIIQLINTKGYDHGHLIDQLKKHPVINLIEARSLRVEEYLKIFLEKYNYRKKDKIEVDF